MGHTLYINVEQVPAVAGSSTSLFGFALNVLPDTQIDSAAMPWTWTAISSWVVWGSKDGGATWDTLHNIMPVNLAQGDDALGQWADTITVTKNRLSRAATEIAKKLKGNHADPTQTAIRITNDEADTPGEHMYVSLLADAASGPYPIPQNLNLSFFVEVPSAYNMLLAAPTFIAASVTYDPSHQPAPGANSNVWTSGDISGITMQSRFLAPDSSGTVPASLWVPVTPPKQTLVSDWQAHVYELVAPYLDHSRGLTGLDDTVLRPLLSTLTTSDWATFRAWIISGLLDLVAPLFATAPTSTEWYAKLQGSSTLKEALQSRGLEPQSLPALNPPNQPGPARPYDRELLELRAIVAAVTSGNVLLSLNDVTQIPKSVPPVLLDVKQASALVAWLEIQPATQYSGAIRDACNTASQSFVDIANSLGTKVISDFLSHHKANGGSWVDSLLSAYSNASTTALANSLVQRAVGTTDNSPAAITSTAPPLVIPVLPMQTSNSGGVNSDPLNRIRGFGLLLRRVKDADGKPIKDTNGNPMKWSCPNVVSPILDSGMDGSKRPLLVAKRLGYSRSLLSGVLQYDNGPLPCQTVLNDYLQTENVVLQNTAQNGTTYAIYRYAPFEEPSSSLYGTPMLECAATYQALCFAISNCGALPVELRGGYPAKLKDLDSTDPASPNGEFPYFRTVPISAAEVRDASGNVLTKPDGFFPAVPNDVYLRSGEFPAPPRTTTLLLAPPTSLWGTEQRIVNATAATRSRFTFSLKLPSIEPQTWDRCAGYKISDKEQRAQILDPAYQALAKQTKTKATEITEPLITSINISLSDAVGTSLGSKQFTIADMRVNGNTVATFPLKVVVDSGTGVNTTSNTPNNDGKVQIGILNGDSPSLVDLAIGLKEGEIYLLSLKYTLDSSVQKMMPQYCNDPKLVWDGYELLIEIASAVLPTVPDLMTATDVQANLFPNRNLVATLPVSQKGWRTIHRVDFLRQTWYWTGRTQPAQVGDSTEDFDPGYFPAKQDLDSDATRRWETVEFAERPWTDHVELLTTPENGSFTWSQDMSLDSRASFFRFAPRIYSRYQGCFEDFAPGGVSTVGDLGTDLWKNKQGNDRWAPCFLRTSAKTLNLPRLKALIPIVESAFTDGTPGILVVFDGASYDQAGLAERLNVKVAKVSDPDPSVLKPWAVAGPDFLMSSEAVDCSPEKQVPLELLACGPIGHTFDDPNSYFPKFTSSSWIVRPKNEGDFAWWFANLEFTLALDSDSAVASSVNVVSPPSIGSWIQFLPGFRSNGKQLNQLLNWSLDWNGAAITLWDDQGQAANAPRGNNERHIEHYLLVTKRVIDITGTSREAYLGVARPQGQSWTLLGTTQATDGVQLRCRFMDIRAGEIGMLNNSVPADDKAFWKRIFGTNQTISGTNQINDETRSSIISLSSVISKRRGAQ